MSKAVRISAPMTVSASSASSEKSDGNALVSIAQSERLFAALQEAGAYQKLKSGM